MSYKKARLYLILTVFVLTVSSVSVSSQDTKVLQIPVIHLLQYQRSKTGGNNRHMPFKEFGLHHIKAKSVMENNDSCILWGYHLHANTDFDKDKQPLYKLFKRSDSGSFAVIDKVKGRNLNFEIIFWSKRYYWQIVEELKRMGFTHKIKRNKSNCLEFNKKGTTVAVDITIWPEIYLVKFYSVEPS